MPKLYNVEAVVLKRTNFGEADKIVTFYTPYLGKITALAKGAQRFKSRRSPHLEPLCYNKVLLAQVRDFNIIRETKAIDAFLPLRESLGRMTYALYAAELVDRFTPERQENRALFQLLLEVLNSLCEVSNPMPVLRYLELHLLQHVGYRPELQRCVNCNANLAPVQNLFSPKDGGTLCPSCPAEQAFPISVNALKVMRFLQRSNLAGARRLKLNSTLSSELKEVMRKYIEYLLEGKLKVRDFLGRVSKDKLATRDK